MGQAHGVLVVRLIPLGTISCSNQCSTTSVTTLWDGAYKISLVANRKAHEGFAEGFLSCYLSGTLNACLLSDMLTAHCLHRPK